MIQETTGAVECQGFSYNVTDIVKNLEFSVCTSTLGVDNTLWDPLTIEVC